MKAFLVLIALVVALIVAGWLTFGRSDGKPAVILETEQIQQDAEQAAERGKELLDEAAQKAEDLRQDQDSAGDGDSQEPPPSNEPEPEDIRRASPPDVLP